MENAPQYSVGARNRTPMDLASKSELSGSSETKRPRRAWIWMSLTYSTVHFAMVNAKIFVTERPVKVLEQAKADNNAHQVRSHQRRRVVTRVKGELCSSGRMNAHSIPAQHCADGPSGYTKSKQYFASLQWKSVCTRAMRSWWTTLNLLRAMVLMLRPCVFFVCFDSEPKGQGRKRAFDAIMGEEARVIQTRRCL